MESLIDELMGLKSVGKDKVVSIFIQKVLSNGIQGSLVQLELE